MKRLLPAIAAVLSIAALSRAGTAAPAKDADFFTIVVMPDTQYYTEVQWKTDQYFEGQTKWIVEHQKDQHIAFVSHVGDLQQDGDLLRMDARQHDEEAKKVMATTQPGDHPANTFQWVRADAAMKILDDSGIPYVAVAGNHDYLHWDRKTLPDFYIKYFGPQRFAGKSWYIASSPASPRFPAGMNSAQLFHAGPYTFLSIGLQYAPDNWDLRWAQKVVDEHPGVPTFITTHAYLTNKGYDKDRMNIWDQFVRKNPQVFMTINGHVNGHNLIVRKDDAGLEVVQILVDYQDLKVPGYANGGAYMRLMRFYPKENKIDVKTYSPVTKQYLTNDKDQFTVPCDFNKRFAEGAAAEKHPTTQPAATASR